MAGFEKTLDDLSQVVLKRELSEREKFEFMELATTLGMENVEDYLYMVMIFKRTEDKVNGTLVSLRERIEERIDEMSALEQKINDTLEASIDRVLGEGAREIGRNMSSQIAAGAKDILAAVGCYYRTRGAIFFAVYACIVSVLSYFMGLGNILDSIPKDEFLSALLLLPAGWCFFFCGMIYTFFWVGDNLMNIRKKKLFKVLFGAQVLALALLALAMI